MVQRICDKCHSNKDVKTYTVPVPQNIIATGGKNAVPLISWNTQETVDGEIDLCTQCRIDFANLVELFKYGLYFKEKEEVKLNVVNE